MIYFGEELHQVFKVSTASAWGGPLPVLQTFRGKEPFSRRGWKRTGDCPRAGRQELLDRDFAAGFQFFVLSRKCLHEGMRDQQS
jgi:hypothetical protein